MNKFNQLSKDIVNAVQLFAEFGSRNEYIRKGRTIVVNDVTDPKGEGIFLARCARKIARKQGVEYAYDWFLKAFAEGVYNRLQSRNKPAPWSKFVLRKDEKELDALLKSCLPQQSESVQ